MNCRICNKKGLKQSCYCSKECYDKGEEEDKFKCCWNEEKQEWYKCESISPNKYQCLGCYKKIECDGGDEE